MNRRSFVGLSLTAFVAALIPWRFRFPTIPPKLWGDGFHDDTDAIQWRIRHAVALPSGKRFRITRTLHVYPERGDHLSVTNAHLYGQEILDGPVVQVHGNPTNWGFMPGNTWFLPSGKAHGTV